MCDRHNKFNETEQQTNFSSHNHSNSKVIYSDVSNNHTFMACNNTNVNTTTNDGLIIKYHQKHQNAQPTLLHGFYFLCLYYYFFNFRPNANK